MMWKLLLLGVLAHAAIIQVQAGNKLKPLAIYPLSKEHRGEDLLGNAQEGIISNVGYTEGPDGGKDSATYFKGKANSFIQFPNNRALLTHESLTMCAWIKHEGLSGPIFNYGPGGHFGCHFWMTNKHQLFVRFPAKRRYGIPVIYNSLPYKKWQFVCGSYNGKTGVASLFVNNRYVKRTNIGKNRYLDTARDARMGVRKGDRRYFKGGISCMQVYASALSQGQMKRLKNKCEVVEVKHELECEANYMVLRIKKPTRYTLASDLHLLDSACVPKDDGKGHFVISFNLTECGTKVKTTNTHLVYTNQVIGRKENSKLIGRVKDIRIDLKCSYKRRDLLHSKAVEPNQDKFRGASHEDGKFIFGMQLFPNRTYSKPYARYPVHIQLRQRVFVEVSVETDGYPLSIVATRCFATPTRQMTGPRHVLINNRCPFDRTLRFHKRPTLDVQRFSFQNFKFLHGRKYFFIHCHVLVCDGNKKNTICARGAKFCPKKKLGKRGELQLNQDDDVIERSLEERLDEAVVSIPMPVHISEE